MREVNAESSNYDGLGADLKAARVRNGFDLAEITEELRIRRGHIQAMEEGHFDDLPAPVYAVGFVRSYADYLGLDGEIAVEAFKQEVSGLKGETKLAFPSPIPESRVPTGWLIAISLVLAGMIYAGWYYAEMNGRLATDRVPPLPQRLAALAPAPSVDEPASSEPVPVGPVETEETPAEGPTTTDTVTGINPATIGVEVDLRQIGGSEFEQQSVVERSTDGGLSPASSGILEDSAADTSSVPVDAVSDDPFRVNLESLSSVTEAMMKMEIQPSASGNSSASTAVEASEFSQVAGSETPLADVASQPNIPDVVRVFGHEDRFPSEKSSTEPSAITTTKTPIYVPVPVLGPAIVDGTQVASASATLGLSERQPRIFGEGNWEARVVIKATTESWVQVLSRDGDLLLTRILRPGDQYLVPNRNDLFLMTGNAGGIEITVDGKPVPAIGEPGVARDSVALVPERLLSGTAVDQ